MITEEMELLESIKRCAENALGAIEVDKLSKGKVMTDGNLKLVRNAAQFILNDVADILSIRANK